MHRLPERIRSKITVDESTGCWLWTASLTHNGYGQCWQGTKQRKAHVVVYEILVGVADPDRRFDHQCHDPEVCRLGDECPHRRCVNPAHLLPATPKENNARRFSPQKTRTHCPKGHPYDETNTYEWRGKRACRCCRNEAATRSKRKAQRVAA